MVRVPISCTTREIRDHYASGDELIYDLSEEISVDELMQELGWDNPNTKPQLATARQTEHISGKAAFTANSDRHSEATSSQRLRKQSKSSTVTKNRFLNDSASHDRTSSPLKMPELALSSVHDQSAFFPSAPSEDTRQGSFENAGPSHRRPANQIGSPSVATSTDGSRIEFMDIALATTE